jgi:D-beta-D-heptose 7-phosphate kinase/D-beta-D-heptose 1-phosphate adenosyltransferase
MTLSDFEVWERAGDLLVRQLELDAYLITLDRDGMYLTERTDRRTLIRTAPVAVSDVTGAGDVVLSTFGYFAAAGYSFPAAAQLANLAAGIEVSRLGADVISREDLLRAFCGRKEAVERESSVDVAKDRTADEHVLKQ